ncbi:outer membrane receptor for ferrienterochelin and colicins [Tenacibaculum adriaticum]|uniref:Outer membrane receptor for ferrienterochelin and colicins n=1 Tax=Tenacibaculum adriaticum TaxID=413713 RepID=A0A5S5DTZ2_9FLAO|nr:TonB-dependent receptor [Tenacibaculum adriaticum]TYP99245.1 outer membrane receptor for ferrienterochelin and colicins [Tenacibaculum adriaticum]
MFLNKKAVFFFLLVCYNSFSQEKRIENDSLINNKLDEVVVTGQYNPQSIKKSIHNVIVIKREQIEYQAANNLADLLNFNLNLTIIPSSQSGKSTISFFGLDSQYFNILIDNIPLVSDNGLGNNIDLTQVNLDDVERIEIVEGAMGVEYGANAVSGVINIITKKSIKSEWNIKVSLQEETVSDEYAFFDEGRHIQGLNVSHNFNENWFARAGFNRNQFAGFYNDRQGRDYYQNDGLRGYDWLPKNQINANGLLNYRKENFNLFYKFEYFNELINYYGAAVRANIDTQAQTSNPSATDRIFTTDRIVNNLNVNGRTNSGANYNVSLSYQQQKRYLNEFNYYIISQEKTNEIDEVYQSSKVFFSKGSINNLVKSDFYNYQLGYEARFLKGFDTQASGDVTQQDKTQSQINSAVYGSSEVNLSNKFLLRPGIRYEYNSKFQTKLLASLSARYLMKNGFELRGNIGSSYRTPNFEELYYYFVDSNHDVRGNENLNPENGFTAFLNLKKRSWFKNTSLLNTLKLSYIDVNDKIDLAIVNTTPLQYQYINIDAYKLWGITSENSIKTNNWTFNLGATLQGISRIVNNEVNAENDFLYSFQLNTSSTYQIKKWNTAITLLLKHNGKQQNYIASGTDEEGNSLFEKSTTRAYNWLDTSVKKSFFNNKIQATFGARNLFDITNVNVSNASTGGVHASDNSSLLLGYGRSYYLKLLYNLNF